jgi:8-oxo-dGTP pyrophosphatase MutT (NUDIX family)
VAPEQSWPARFEGHDYPQILPEPDEIRPGLPAPWAQLDAERRTGLGLALVVERLKYGMRHFETAPLPSDGEMEAVVDAEVRPITRRSAVLVALFEEECETHLVLTRRSFSLREHRGEIALPGGRSDEGESPTQTALREAREEVGLDESSVETIGWLSPLVTFAFGSSIWPVIGVLAQRPEFVPNPAEVERVFTVSLADLLADGAFVEEQWRRDAPRFGADGEGFFPIYFYRVPGEIIWGATARVLTELLCVVTGVEWPEAKRVWP